MEQLYFFESEIKMPVMKLPVRCTAVKLKNALILISPISFSQKQIDEIKALGEVTDIVAPSVFHHLSIPKAKELFPKATVWGVPGLVDKRQDIVWNKIFTKDPWPYQDQVDFTLVEGVPKMTEVAFFCKGSRALIVTDLCFNLQNPKGLGAFLILHMMGTYKRFAVSRLVERYMQDKPAFKSSVSQILTWDFEQVIMAHGDIVPTRGKALLAAALKDNNYL